MTNRARGGRAGRLLAAPALVVLALGACEVDEAAEAPPAPTGAATDFEVDPYFPRELPDDWIVGQVSGIAVDDRDHVWVLHRPTTLSDLRAGAVQDPPQAMCCVPAPPVLELDPDGNVVQGWGGPAENGEYEWPDEEHGLHVDHEGNVWVGGGLGGHNILKFTRDGEFLFQIGEKENTGGSNDPDLLGGPASMEVDPETNELYIADGYGNRRVAVYDAGTGEYLRHWGAYGEEPDDGVELGDYQPNEPPADQFRGPVHGVTVSHDGLVYVTDRGENRIQVFERDGTFVDELVIRPETLSMGSTWDVALSTDPDQTYLYVPDGVNKTVWVVDRESLEVVNNFARGGRWAGQLGWVHNVAVDSRGNVFVTEVETGKRFQKFTPR